MTKKARNISIGITVLTLAIGGYALHKSKSNSELDVRSLTPSPTVREPLPTAIIKEIIYNEDGSINFKLEFPEEYSYNKDDNLPEVIENEDGSINFKCDFPEEEKEPVKKYQR